MTTLDSALREALEPLRNLELDDHRLQAARERARAGGPSRRRWHRAAGATVAVAGIAGVALVLGLLVVVTPSEQSESRESAVLSPAPPPIKTYPDTVEGRRDVTTLFRELSSSQPKARVRLGTIEAALSRQSPHGEYTVWTARTRDPQALAVVFSSPRLGAQPALRRGLAATPGQGIRVVIQVRSPVAKANELYGSVAPTVTRVVAVLRNGDRTDAITGSGWFILSLDTGHPPPVRLLALNATGARVGAVVLSSE